MKIFFSLIFCGFLLIIAGCIQREFVASNDYSLDNCKTQLTFYYFDGIYNSTMWSAALIDTYPSSCMEKLNLRADTWKQWIYTNALNAKTQNEIDLITFKKMHKTFSPNNDPVIKCYSIDKQETLFHLSECTNKKEYFLTELIQNQPEWTKPQLGIKE